MWQISFWSCVVRLMVIRMSAEIFCWLHGDMKAGFPSATGKHKSPYNCFWRQVNTIPQNEWLQIAYCCINHSQNSVETFAQKNNM